MKDSPIVRYLFPPRIGNYARRQKVKFLHVSLLVTAIAVIPMGILNIRAGAVSFAVMLFAIAIFSAFALILNQRGHYTLAATFLSIFILAAIIFTIIDGAALNDPGVVALPLFILLTSFFFDKKAVIASTIISILFLISLYFLDTSGLLELAHRVFIDRVVILSILMAVTGLISWTIADMRDKNITDVMNREVRIRAIFDQATSAIFTFNDETIVDYNTSALQLFGVSSDEIVGKIPFDFSPPTQRDGRNSRKKGEEVINLALQGDSQHLEWTHMHRNGELIDSEVRLQRVDLEEENMLLATVTDLTERDRAEGALRESETRYRAIVEDQTEFVVRWLPDGTRTYVNDAYCRYFGLSKEEAIGSRYMTLVAEEDREWVREKVAKISIENPIEIGVHRVINGDGSTGWQEWTDRGIFDQDDELIEFQSVGRDVTEQKLTEKALIESEERFQLLANAAFEGIVISDQGRVVDANDQLARMFGYERLELIGIHAKELVAPESWTLVSKNINRGYEKPYEHLALRKDGSIFPVEVRGRTIPYAGKTLRVTAIRDITESKRAEAELRASEARYRSLIENLPVPLFIHADEEILFVNPATVQVAGLTSPDDYVGKSVWDFIPSDLRDTYAERFETLYEQRTHIDLEESRLVNSEGAELDVEIIATPIEYAGRQAAQTIIRDISDRKSSEEALRQSELRYRTLYENANDAIFLMKDEYFVDCNPSAEEKLNAPRDAIIGKTPFDFSPSTQPDGRNSREKGMNYLKRALEGEPQHFEWLHQRQDETTIEVEVNLNRVEIEDEVLLFAIWRDMTERKRAEEVAREERQRLARDLHDAVSQTLWSSTLIADVLPDIWEQNVDKGRERLERLRQLTHGALAEMRALLLELRPSTLIESPLAEILQSLADAAASRTRAVVDLSVSGECQLPQEVHLATYRITQEALSNSVRHASSTSIEIGLRCEPNSVKLEISDDGRGFDPKNLPSGTHLGIGIMHERADGVEGFLEILSEPRRGTKVSFSWAGK